MTWIIASLSVVILVATLLPLAKHPHWSVRAMEFPRLQLVTMTAVALMLCIAFFKLSLLSVITMFVLTACLCFQLWWILPYTPLWPVEVKHATSNTQTMSILTANVLQTNRQFSLLLS
ncbi:hypothetical protein [Pseudoalteromonas sp. McH1-7]|uniref:hypothetical protein n=1 Tax=Pseudoalteromonas sp. McH1-7 TaxID=2745574 RepID=UPI0020CA3A50|nr:hypothetical protein [Pseudoalteromonas sp. McH1-7]